MKKEIGNIFYKSQRYTFSKNAKTVSYDATLFIKMQKLFRIMLKDDCFF